MTSKELFLKQKDLRRKLAEVVHEDWFAQCLTYVRSELIQDASVGLQELKGAKAFERILLDLPDEDLPEIESPKSGIHHDLDVVRKSEPKRN